MPTRARFALRFLLLAAACLASAAVAHADFVQTLHTFKGGASDGATPGMSRLVEGSDGFLYGVTQSGGVNNGGTFFRIRKDGTGFIVLHSFAAGAMPTWLIQWTDGNFYGTEYDGGVGYFDHIGSVFRVAADGTYSTAFRCTIFGDGYNPIAVLAASNGWIYALMSRGGIFPATRGGGTSIQLLTDGGTLVQFQPGMPCGYAHQFSPWLFNYQPGSYLIQASDGNIYGVKSPVSGGAFQVSGVSGGPLTMFDAQGISTGLEEGPDAALYGVLTDAGACGRIDRLTTTTRAVLHAFDCVADAGHPRAAPLSGGDGFMYGTTQNTFYRISPSGAYTPLAHMNDGAAGALLHGSDGRFYGMTANTIFRVMPSAGFDEDGAADMPMYDATTGTWRILMSTSGYRSSLQIFWGGPDYTPVPADYDGDGRLDVAVYHAGRGIWYVLTSSSSFTNVLMKTLGGLGAAPVPGDFDNDHRADFAVYRPATGTFTVAQSSTSTTRTITMSAAGGVPVRGDFDGDGIADAAVYAPATGAWRILTSGSGFATLVTKTLGGPGFTPVTGDYDGDHIADVAVYNGATGDWNVVESSTHAVVTVGWGGTGYAPVPGDYDGDGKNDLGVYNAALGEWVVLLSSSDFTTTLRAVWGTPIESPVTTLPVRTTWNDTLRATDFDGDGISDMAVYEPSTGVWSILTSSSRFTRTMTVSWGAAPGDVPVPGDYDGDGITDPGVFNAATGTWTLLRSARGGLTVALGGAGDLPVRGDYDGDGVTDLAVYNVATGMWRMALSSLSSSFEQTRTTTYGLSYLNAVPADYDGDGRVDLGLYDPYSGDWQALLAKNAYATPPMTVAWGGTTYIPFPADFDGDGKADFGVCVNATGHWYVLKSGFAYSTSFSIVWGGPVDMPLSADFDGDGIADMASYAATTGEWRVLLSSSDFTLPLERTLGGPGFIVPRMP